jgi:hypothetical protein
MMRWLMIACALLALAGCDRRWLRDDYMGKSWLQPELAPQVPPRDAQGDPVIAPAPAK